MANAGIQRAYGWRRQAPDPRDKFLDLPIRRGASPYVDLQSGMGQQLDQGAQGSCGPNTTDEMWTYDQIAQGLPSVGASRHFIYWWTRFLMGTTDQDSGVDNRTMLKALATYGVCSEVMDPYSDSLQAMVVKPTPAMNAAALPNKLVDYAAVIQNLGQMKAVIEQSRRPFMFGFEVFPQMESDEAATTGIVRDPSAGATAVGGHDVTHMGFSDVDRPGVTPGNHWPAGTFKFRNHWMNTPDQPWGDGGYGYISYNYCINPSWASDFWVFNRIPGATPTPIPIPPTPVPIPIPSPDIVAIKKQIDEVFRQALKLVIWSPRMTQILKQVQAQVDKILDQYRSGRRQMSVKFTVPDWVMTIIDAGFLAAEMVYPEDAKLIDAVKDAVDHYLPLVNV